MAVDSKTPTASPCIARKTKYNTISDGLIENTPIRFQIVSHTKAPTTNHRRLARSDRDPEITTETPFANRNDPISHGDSDALAPSADMRADWLTTVSARTVAKRSWPIVHMIIKATSAHKEENSRGFLWKEGEATLEIVSREHFGRGVEILQQQCWEMTDYSANEGRPQPFHYSLVEYKNDRFASPAHSLIPSGTWIICISVVITEPICRFLVRKVSIKVSPNYVR